MNDKVLSAEQIEKLQEHINNDDRTGFYASLAEMTGSKIAIDMAQTSSFSGFQGAAALYANAYAEKALNALHEMNPNVPGYHPGGVIDFSNQIAGNVMTTVENLSVQGMPVTENDLFSAAKNTWTSNGIGDFFPGNSFPQYKDMDLASPGVVAAAGAGVVAVGDFIAGTAGGFTNKGSVFTDTVGINGISYVKEYDLTGHTIGFHNKEAYTGGAVAPGALSRGQMADFLGYNPTQMGPQGLKAHESAPAVSMEKLAAGMAGAGFAGVAVEACAATVVGAAPAFAAAVGYISNIVTDVVSGFATGNFNNGVPKSVENSMGSIPDMMGMSFKELTQYGPGIATNAAPTAPSIASTLDVHGIAAPSVELTGTVSVNGVAHSNFGSISIETVGIGSVGVAPTSNFATPSLAEALGLAQQEAAAAAAAAARHEAFVAQTAMEADVLNNQQHALAVETQHAVDAMQAIEKMEQSWADMFGTVPAAAMTGPQVYDPYSDKMVSATAGQVAVSPGYAPMDWSDFCAAQGLSVTSGLPLDADNVGSIGLDFSGDFGFAESMDFAGGWSDSLTDAAAPGADMGADPNDTGGFSGGSGEEGFGGGDNIGDAGDDSSASNDGGGYGGGPSGGGGAGYGGEDRDANLSASGGNYGSNGPDTSTSESSSSSSSSSESSSGSSSGNSGNSGGVGGGAGSASEGSGSYAPVVLDLDGDGVELVDASGGAQYDTNDDGTRERLGWAGKDDGLLAIDLDGDGKITGAKELSFAMHTAEQGDTDLQGLARVFDSNKDGVLDAQDNEFSKFRIWQDKDGDGVSDKGEVKTLAEMGIKSIGVVSDGKSYTQAGNTVHGTASYTKTDGTTRSVGDVDFKIAGKGSKPTAPNNVGDDEDGDDEDFDRGARQALTAKIPTRLPEMSTSGGAIALAAAMGIAAVEATNALAAAKAGELGTAGAADNTLVLTAKGEAVNAAVPVAVMGGSSAGDELTVGATTAASRLNVGDVIAATMGQGPQSLRYLDHDPRPLEDVIVERQLIAMGFGPDRFTYDEPDFNTRITQLQKELFGIEAVSDTTASAPSLAAGDVVGLEDSWIKLAIKVGLTDTDGSEMLLPVRISGVPAGAILSAGKEVAPGIWEVSAGSLGNLQIKPAPNDAHDFKLNIQATSYEESNGATTSVNTSCVVEVAATVDEMITLQGQNSVGLSGTTGDQVVTGNGNGNVIWGGGGNDVLDGMGGNDVLHGDDSNQTATAALDLTAIVPDPNDVQGFWVTISGLPAGATLSIGFDLGNGQWRVGGLELTNLTVSWPANAGDLNLSAVATGFDIDPDTGNIATKDGPPAAVVITASDAYGDDILTGGAGNDTLISQGGTDQLSGGANNDTYVIGNNDGATINATIHNDATTDAGETDTLKLFSNLSPEDIWFQKQGADLIVKLLDGSNGTITLADWYANDEAKLDTITIEGGEHLDRSKVDQLVQEMANYGSPPSPDAPLPQSVQTAIDDAWEP